MRKATGPPVIKGLKQMADPIGRNTLDFMERLRSFEGKEMELSSELRRLQVMNLES